jgi:hypothetical protein
MASSINPYNINGNYPVAGQDNDSQGFRDNFTNTRNNLVFTKSEIEDLQNKVLLKSPLAGGSFSDPGFNNLDGAKVTKAQLKGWFETKVLHEPAGSSVNIDFSEGNFHTIETSAAATLTFSSFPSTGWGKLTLYVDVTNVAHTLTFPAGVVEGIEKIRGFDGVDTIEFDSTGIYVFELASLDAGASFFINELSRNLIAYEGSEDLADSAAASPVTSVSYFTTAAAETSTLAAGYEGQTKVFAMKADGGDMVITVTNAGWKSTGTGTITFSAIGQACQLQYFAGKWFCIGNNGAAFA